VTLQRPDTFVGFETRDREGLCEASGLTQALGYEGDWDSTIARVMEADWWSSPPPRPAMRTPARASQPREPAERADPPYGQAGPDIPAGNRGWGAMATWTWSVSGRWRARGGEPTR
jgi:hypothetical protein